MKASVFTLGCKVNTYESQYMVSLLINHGYEITDFHDICDIYIINTCTVTNNSDNKSKKMIEQAKKRNQNALIIVCGCFVESNKDYGFEGVDVVIGNYHKSDIISLIEEARSNKTQIIKKPNILDVPFENMNLSEFSNQTRAFIKIQDGCNNYCSFCIIPYVRGNCRSKKREDVINEIKTFITNGYKEIVLTGIHTGNYGVELGSSFSSLLEEILETTTIERVRISSIEATELDDHFFKLLLDARICNHLHIPLQSGSDSVLNRMNRKYNKNKFRDIISKIRSVRPDVSITTDVIVGFPEETSEEFIETINFIKEINFSKIHVFPYSKRDGTVAAKMLQIDNVTKKQRVKELISLSDELEKKYKDQFINKICSVLIEKTINGYSYGHTTNYLYLKINKVLEKNKIYDIRITKNMIKE